MRYCLHGRKSEKTGCTDESLESLAAQTKARTDPVRSDNRWQRKSELSINSGYVHEGRRTLAKVCVGAGSHLC